MSAKNISQNMKIGRGIESDFLWKSTKKIESDFSESLIKNIVLSF